MPNKQITLAARPVGFPKDSDFQLVESPIPEPGEGEFLVQNEYLSVDPYMRGRMSEAKSYANPVELGDVMTGECVGKVIESKSAAFPVGAFAAGNFGWQQYAVGNQKSARIVDESLAPIQTSLHMLGMPGLTAYFGVLDVCEAKSGNTLVCSGGAGAVGSVVGQIAKIIGCRAIGIAGSDEKVKHMTNDLGYDDGFNYKKTDNFYKAIQSLCPRGIDYYFDNVGGPITDAVFPQLNNHARVAVCGQISMYNATEMPQGPRQLGILIVKRARVEGFLVSDFAAKFAEARQQLAAWYKAGKLHCRERITEGIENAPAAFMEMLQGANIGKQLVKLN